MRATLIRPGLLVSLKTNVRGGVSYATQTIEADRAEGASRRAKWETTRVIVDAVEHEAAVIARGKARTAVSRICCASTFGLLCPQSNEDQLQAAIEEAQGIADAHNKGAVSTRLDVFVITGRIADSDEQAAKAIGSEVRDLLAAMEAGVKAASPEAIREAANKARALAGMLSPDVQTKVSNAISEVRAIAREIVSRVEKSGERAADVVLDVRLAALERARFAVLDLTEGEAADETPVSGLALDFAPADGPGPAMTLAAPALQFEMGA